MPRRLLVLALAVAVATGVAVDRSGGGASETVASAAGGLARSPARQLPDVPPDLSIGGQGDGAATQPAPQPGPAPPRAVDVTVTPVAAGDPAGLAGQIVTAEQAIRAPATAAELAYFGHLQQVAYRALALRPEWDAEVAAALPDDLRPVMAANVAAGRELRRPHRTPQTKLPAWRIVEPPPASELRAYYEEGEATFGVPWEYLAAVNLTETRMGRIRGLSSAGAQGPMQFIPGTWEAYGEGDINDPRDAILSAARYLAANGGGSGNLPNALFRYNPVSWYVDAVTAYAEQIVADERAYLGYYNWQVYYTTSLGDVLLPVGYEATERRPVTPADLG
ncbi:MAG: transglycosylase SLT domain-containing protein [Acidimicrobiales bacterium]